MPLRILLASFISLGLVAQSKANLGNAAFTNAAGMAFVRVPAGSFQMGAPDGHGEASEHPTHGVTFAKPFFIGACPVTQAQWRSVIHANPSKFPGDDRPVDFVSREDARSFAARLSELDTDGNVYRLPTEAEWEYACRAGSNTSFSFGNQEEMLPDFGWFDANAGGGTHPVARKKPNAWGLFDMHGNVWEWVEDDWHENYAGAPTDGSAWTSSALPKKGVIRGGSWAFAASDARSKVGVR